MRNTGLGRLSAAAIVLVVLSCLVPSSAFALAHFDAATPPPQATLNWSQVTVNPNGSVTYKLAGSSLVNDQSFTFSCVGSYDPASREASERLTEQGGNEIQSRASCLTDPWEVAIVCSNVTISSKGYDSAATAYIVNLMAPISAQALSQPDRETLKAQLKTAQTAAARSKSMLHARLTDEMAVLPTPTRAPVSRFALGAGSAKVGDEFVLAHTPTPTPVPPPRPEYPPYGAAYTGGAPPMTMKVGQVAMVPITVQNRSSQAWPAGGVFHLSFHWFRGGVQIVRDGDRTFMTAAVAPGATVNLTAKVTAPATTGATVLQWDMVQEGVAWFSDRGVPMSAPKSVNVTP